MRRLLLLSLLTPAALAATPGSDAEKVAARALPIAPATSEAQVTCTAVVTLDTSGAPSAVGVAAGETCQGPWAKAAQDAVQGWRWPADPEGGKGHVTVSWSPTPEVTVRVSDAAGLRVVRRLEPGYPPGAAARDLGAVVCRAMVGVNPLGVPAVVAVDACPSEFQASAANSVLAWRWEAPGREGLTRTWVLVTFRPQ